MHGTFDGESPFGNIVIKHKEQMLSGISSKSIVYVHPSAVSLPTDSQSSIVNSQSKHAPCRLFKNGDIVRYVERDGRSYVDAPPVGAKCRVIVGEDSVGMVSVEFKFSENEEPAVHDVPFYHLELVTPVEELEPYSVVDAHTHCDVADKDMNTVSPYSKLHHPYAKAAAEAERDRLNAEWRKEQNNDRKI